jgi:hypothetical protein
LANRPNASNPVINSALNTWQRGTSISIAASSVSQYSADRWYTGTGASQAATVSRQVTGDTTNLPFIQYCARVQRNSGQTGTADYGIFQSFETINSIPFAGKTVTYSFYARAGANFSATSNALRARVYTGTGTDQNLLSSYTGLQIPIDSTATLTTTWQRFTYTGTLSASATELTVGLYYAPTGTASTNDYFEMTGVQIDVGSVALPFRTAGVSYQEELAMCQRYYETFTFRMRGTDTAVTDVIMQSYKVVKRINPSATLTTTSGTAFAVANNLDTGAAIAATGSPYDGVSVLIASAEL